MDKNILIQDLYQQKKEIKEIAKIAGLSTVRVIQILKKIGIRKTNPKTNKKITEEEKNKILTLNKSGKTLIEIFNLMDKAISKPTIKKIILNSGLSINIKEKNKSRICFICGKNFTPKHSNNKNLSKYKTCSYKCRNKAISLSKIKYTEEQIYKVIKLKKENVPNTKIQEETGVNINKIKEIIKNNNLFLPREVAQKNAYKAKLSKNPDFMLQMREKHMRFDQKEYERRIRLLIEDVKNGEGTITGLSKKYGLNGNSVVSTLKSWGGFENLLSISVSTGQKELLSFIKSLGFECFYDSRKIIPPKEIGIFIPEKSVAIEYCGLYWHSEANGKYKKYHYEKLKECNQKGIRLITIYEDEWLEKREQVINFLKSALGKNSKTIFGRKTVVKQISKHIANNFYKENHIQGAVYKSILDIGIFSIENGALLGCMSFGPHHRYNSKNIVILTRLAFIKDLTVVGGSSKMFKFAKEYLKNIGYTKIISWSDNRWSEGNVYKQLGFTLDKELGPDYSYIYKNKRMSKQSNKKKNLLAKGAVGSTESEMAKSLGYLKIWDCGKKRWIYNIA